jgi:hypothetical protein
LTSSEASDRWKSRFDQATSIDVGIQIMMGNGAFAAVATAASVAHPSPASVRPQLVRRLWRFHARGRLVAGVARRQSLLKTNFGADFIVEIVGLCPCEASVKSWDAVVLARIQLRVYDDA